MPYQGKFMRVLLLCLILAFSSAFARPGDVFTITAQNVGIGEDAVNVRVAFNWEEI